MISQTPSLAIIRSLFLRQNPALLAVLIAACAAIAPTQPVLAQYAPSMTGQNGVIAVPAVTVGEQGRMALTFGSVSGRGVDGTLSAFTLNLNPLRIVSLTAGMGFDTPGSGGTKQQLAAGIRAVWFSFAEPSWWNVGVQANLADNMSMNATGGDHFFQSTRILGDLHPFPWLGFQGFAGFAVDADYLSHLTLHSKTNIFGGGVVARAGDYVQILGEYSNGYFLHDPEAEVGMGGVRVFPIEGFAVTAAYGRAFHNNGTNDPVVAFSLSFSTGLMNLMAVKPDVEFDPGTVSSANLVPKVTASSSAALAITSFPVPVQNDMRLMRAITLAKPPIGKQLFDVVDSFALQRECSLVAANPNPDVLVQLTGTETLSSVGDPVRIANRASAIRVAVSAGVNPERITLLDTYSSRRTVEPVSYGMFQTLHRMRLESFQDVGRITVGRVQESLDTLSASLSAMTGYTKARIIVQGRALENIELTSAYAVEEMLFGQSLFSSYNVDIMFKHTDGPEELIVQIAR